MDTAPVWSLPPQDVYQALNTSPQGLSEAEVASRSRQYGFNEIPEPARRPLWRLLADQLTHFLALLLWAAGILAFLAQVPELGWAIWAVIWINALFSFWQEYKAERALAELNKVLPLQARVLRAGTLRLVPIRELVPGDVIQLEEGDRVSADARLVTAESLYLDVSVLTGEALPVHRRSGPVPAKNLRPAEVSNLVFAGSIVARGRGQAVVLATGTRTEFGKIAHLTVTVERERSTLEVHIRRIIRVITTIALTMGTVVFLLTNFLVGLQVKESFIFAIGIIVAFVPEGLLPTVTLSLAIGVQRMARRNALVRRLSSVETLSATTVICTDKTGTLTKNEMTVRFLWVPSTQVEVTGAGYAPEGEIKFPDSLPLTRQVKLLLAGSALCSNARLVPAFGSGSWQEIGDPMEGALLVAAMKAGLNPDALHQLAPRLHEDPFDSHRKMMTVVLDWQALEIWDPGTPQLAVIKGAPLEVVQKARYLYRNAQRQEITAEDCREITGVIDRLAGQGFRLLGLAIRPVAAGESELDVRRLEEDLSFVGLIAILDPPRPGVKEAIQSCRRAGIQVTMVTGDYGLTARAIAGQIGLLEPEGRVVSGRELDDLAEGELQGLLREKTGIIFARVTPEHKLRLVQAYKAAGEVVAVTGDGVNDAPALRAAHIGVAMGISGTDVAREAADIVLTDDNFATIVGAIEQGRAIYNNIRKFITYILASNMAEVIPFISMVLFKIPPALTIMQILAIDLGTDMIPALALGAEKPEAGLMEEPPRPKERPILDWPLLLRAYGFLGLIEALGCMVGFLGIWWSFGYNLNELEAFTPALLARTAEPKIMAIYQLATTFALAAIVACQDGNIFACRSEKHSILRLGFFTNRLIWLGIAVEWTLILAIIYFPPLVRIFETSPPTPLMWLSLLFGPVLLLAAEEARKWFRYGRNSRSSRVPE